MYQSEKDHPAYKIFHWLFDVVIPSAFTRSEEEIERYGMTSTGNRAYDAELAGERTKVMLTIAELATKASQGCPIQLVNPDNAAVIADLIAEYMRVWATEVEQQFGHLDPEYVRTLDEYKVREKDVLILEEFAALVQPVKDSLPKAFKPNSLIDRIRQLSWRTTTQTTTAPLVGLDAPTALSSSLSGGPVRGTAKWR